MTAIELYEKETGNKSPNNQIAYHEWQIDYVRWLEQSVVKNISSNPSVSGSLPLAVEFGYKQCEKGNNIEMALIEFNKIKGNSR